MSIFNKMFGRSKKLDELERKIDSLEKYLSTIPSINKDIDALRKDLADLALYCGLINTKVNSVEFGSLISVAKEALRQQRAKEWTEAKKDLSDWHKTQRPLCEQEKDALMLRLLKLAQSDNVSGWKDDVEKICNDLRAKYGIPTKSVEAETKTTDDKADPVVEEKKEKPVKRAKRRFKKPVKKSSKKAKPENKAVTETAFVTSMNAASNEGTVG